LTLGKASLRREALTDRREWDQIGRGKGSEKGEEHMARACDILIFGSGSFAQRIACDLAATATEPIALGLAGRNAARLAWIATAARARADMFARPLRLSTYAVDLAAAGAAGALLAKLEPAVVVQAASLQAGAVIAAGGTAWGRLVAEGGLSATAVIQALLSARIARAMRDLSFESQLINGCFPDVANGILAGMGLPVLCGIGNIAILSHAFAGCLAEAEPRPDLKMLCHYQNIAAWRRPRAERGGTAPRVWLDGREVDDVFARFAPIQLTPEPVIDISGASGVTLMLAVAHGRAWRGHVPGPAGLPGGYPVVLRGGKLDLDLPAGLSRADAVAWNARNEAENGLLIGTNGRAEFTGRLHERLSAESPTLAAGFHVDDLEAVGQAFGELRDRLLTQSA
jgi:hypothetical protein